MKIEFKLDEEDVRQAIAKWVGDAHGKTISPESVRLDAAKRYGQFDEVEIGHYITATISEGR